MTVPQARMLQEQFSSVDGAREVCETLVDIARALTGEAKKSSPPPTPSAVPDSVVLIPELQAVLEQISQNAARNPQ